MTADLKPCPFCGQQKFLCMLAEGEKDTRQYQVVCDASGDGGCGASCGWQDTMRQPRQRGTGERKRTAEADSTT